MTTIADSLQNAADALNNAVTNVLGVRDAIATELDAKAAQTTTIINNFLTRPLTMEIYCDPINGLDTNDGATVTTPLRSIETILGNLSSSAATTIYLLNDITIQKRYSIIASLTFVGIQPSGAAPGHILFNRKISFLGTAINSPVVGVGTFCSGFWCYGPAVTTNYISYDIPDQPAGQTYSAHFYSGNGTSFHMENGVVTVDATTAGSLIGSGTRSTIFFSMTLGQNVPGHLFQNVAAGANPNSVFYYVSNVTSG